MTQALNRKTVKKRKLVPTSFGPPQSDPERLISVNSSSPVPTVVVSGNSYVAFLYTEKQLTNLVVLLRADDTNSCVLSIDTIFTLYNM